MRRASAGRQGGPQGSGLRCRSRRRGRLRSARLAVPAARIERIRMAKRMPPQGWRLSESTVGRDAVVRTTYTAPCRARPSIYGAPSPIMPNDMRWMTMIGHLRPATGAARRMPHSDSPRLYTSTAAIHLPQISLRGCNSINHPPWGSHRRPRAFDLATPTILCIVVDGAAEAPGSLRRFRQTDWSGVPG